MKQITPWRIGLIAVITLVSLFLVYPSARYFMALRNPDVGEERLEELRQKAIPLGLDLRGGVDVTLMIDEEESIESATQAMAQTLRNAFQNQKLSAKVETAENGRDIRITALDPADARQIRNEALRFAEDLEGDIDQATLEAGETVTVQLDRNRITQSFEQDIRAAKRIIDRRVDEQGLTQPSISIQGGRKIRVQVPGEKNPERLIENLTRLARMEFRLTHPDYGTPRDPIQRLIDAEGNVIDEARVPLGYEVLPYRFGSINPETGETTYERGYMLVEREARLTGKDLQSTGVIQDQFDLQNPIKVSLQLKPGEPAETFFEMSRDSAEKGKNTGNYDNLAVVLDNVVISAPRMQVAIAGGSATIEGGFTYDEALDLSQLLKAGSLPAPLIVESKHAVGATLGNESILAGVNALGIGTALVVVFMVLYYGGAGVISVIALTLNILMILAIMSLADATLTLSGIGGILLTVGMAVDANVLIYERIREEVDGGRPLKQSISVGFARAFTVILDSNLTTLMTALVLLQFTEGSVRGFALALTFGLLANLYTGLTVTHTLCALWFNWRGKLSLGALRPFQKTMIDFVKRRSITWSLSAIMLVAGIGLVIARGGLSFGVDFEGGLISEVRFERETSETELRSMLAEAGLTGERVQHIPDSDDYIIRVKMLELSGDEATQIGPLQKTQDVLEAALTDTFGDQYAMMNVSSFGPETGQTFRRMAIQVIILASLAILAYLWLRFELVFGVAAVIALIHDLLITVTFATLWNVDITLDVVAALMVMLGFSVNDTIVIFDRIRENVRRMPTKPFGEVINISINQSLSRTLITTGTALLVIVVMLTMGGEGLRPFAKILFIGALVGTYSSFGAAPIVHQWNERRKGKLVESLKAKKKQGPEEAQAPDQKSKSGGKLPSRSAV